VYLIWIVIALLVAAGVGVGMGLPGSEGQAVEIERQAVGSEQR